ncbi:MAG: GxxExxY protein [Planctomycetota bacterium]|jgi:GxxExxY protein
MNKEYRYSDLSENIIAAAYNVHNELGQGFLEKVYKNAMAIELDEKGIKCKMQVPLTVKHKDRVVGEYYADIIVNEKIVLEIKAVRTLNPSHELQLVNYLKATEKNVGLLINFGKSVEIKRRVFG